MVIYAFDQTDRPACPVSCPPRLVSLAMADQAGVTVLSSGKTMPRVGMGTALFPFDDGEGRVVQTAVLSALDAGYRHFDTAAVYHSERALGEAVAEAVRAGTVIASRDELYVTSKLWMTDAHPGRVLPALRKTLQ